MERLDGERLKWILLRAHRNLQEHEEEINRLNVFPVPDGDTGTNMLLTLSAVAEGLNDCSSLGEVLDRAAERALLGARGNSGVILAQFLAGFAAAVDGKQESLDGEGLAQALKRGTDEAYRILSHPKEGTILTVMRSAAERAAELQGQELTAIFTEVLQHAHKVLAETPKLLPVLARAGVVDAGGLGFVYILQAFVEVLAGEPLPSAAGDGSSEGGTAQRSRPQLERVEAEGPPAHRYCTEFTLRGRELHLSRLKEGLEDQADSVLVIGSPALAHIHLHTDDPGWALQRAAAFGHVAQVKIDDMYRQYEEFLGGGGAEVQERLKTAVIAVAPGEGLAEILKSLGAASVLQGNPTVGEVLEAIAQVQAEGIILLPNDKEIILTCERAAELSQRAVETVPSRSLPQGISALLAFDPQNELSRNSVEMHAALARVRSGALARAVRPSQLGGLEIKEGEFIGTLEGEIVVKGSDLREVALKLLERLVTGREELCTLFYGAEVREPEAAELQRELMQQYPGLEVQVYYGGQPHYHYIVALE